MKSVRVLLVEDNPADVDLVRESLSEDRLSVDLMVATDGLEGLDALHARGRFQGAALPDVIVLDLNLPRMSGREFLESIRQEDILRRIPVVVLTSSDAERDVAQSYDAGANCYVTKPLDLRAFQHIVQQVEDFWFTIVKLPPTSK